MSLIKEGEMKKLVGVFLLIFLVSNLATPARPVKAGIDQSFVEIFKGLNKLTFTGTPGIITLTDPAIPLVISSNDSTPANQVVIAGSKYGKGLVFGFSHDSFLSDSNLDYFDNKKFTSNILNNAPKKKILISVSHGEYFNKSNSNKLADFAKSIGFEVQFLNDEINENVLQTAGILISGSAWIDFKDSEISAIKDFVNNDGVLLLAGLGWSWVAYHPDKTLEELPANKMGKEFGMSWVDGVINESKENIYYGATVFKIFYPDSLSYVINIDSALRIISEDLENHKNDLNVFLSNSEDKLGLWVRCLETLYNNVNYLSQAKKDELFYKINALIKSNPYYFQKDHAFSKNTESTIAWIREKMVILFYAYAMPLDAQKKSLICETLNLKELYKDIWEKFNVLILDNNSLYEKNLKFLYDLLSSLSIGTHNLKLILIGKALGMPVKGLYLINPDEKKLIFDMGDSFATNTNIGYAIDLWDTHIDEGYENPFPDDVPSREDPYFSGAAAHELTHIIDFNLVYKNKELYNERQQLLKNAGENHLNYLRSMIEDGFFIKNPAEFLASIANQYFCNTWNTLSLALARFNKNYKEPINQFLFFVRVLSMDNNFAPFYTRTESGTKLVKKDIRIEKDTNGRIIQIDDSQNWKRYLFDIDNSGNVTNIRIEKLSSNFEVIGNIVNGQGEIIIDNTSPIYGSDVTVEIKPKENYRIAKVLDNSSDVINSITNNKYVIKSINKNHNIEVCFELISYKIFPLSNLGGSISPSGSITVNSGTDQTFTITPNAGYKIKDVLVDGKSVGAVSTYTFDNITSDYTIEATFEPITFTIATSAGLGGSISPSGTITVNSGDSKTFTITPYSGYKISDVKVDGVSIGAVSSYTFTNIASNHTIEATFEKEITETVIILQIGNTTFTVNGESRTLDSPPIIKNNRTLLPIRAIIEALNGTIGWDPNEKKVTVTLGSTNLELWIGKNTARVNGVDTPIDSSNSKVVPEIINSRTMLPLRFVTENLGCDVQWDGTTKTITITYGG